MRAELFVYLSGPITARDGVTIEENVAGGLRVFLDCIQRGIPAFCPHLSGAFPSAWALVAWDRWLAYDLAVIDRCTHVLMLPRWEQSVGARREYDHAVARGTPVIYTLDALPGVGVERGSE